MWAWFQWCGLEWNEGSQHYENAGKNNVVTKWVIKPYVIWFAFFSNKILLLFYNKEKTNNDWQWPRLFTCKAPLAVPPTQVHSVIQSWERVSIMCVHWVWLTFSLLCCLLYCTCWTLVEINLSIFCQVLVLGIILGTSILHLNISILCHIRVSVLHRAMLYLLLHYIYFTILVTFQMRIWHNG